MNKREFITLIGGAAAAWPLAARGQQAGKLPIIGYLGTGTPASQTQWLAAFSTGLQELGWTQGRNLKIEVRWAEGRSERFSEIATEFLRLKVDVMVTSGGGVPALKQATSTIPIVFSVANDPVGSGYVASLARPGGNITGLSLESSDLVGKRLELLREIAPSLSRLATLGPSGNPSVILEMGEVRDVSGTLGIEVVPFEVASAKDIALAFEALKDKAQALYVVSSPLTTTNRIRINILAAGARLPTMYGYRDSVETGGLISYGANFLDLWRHVAAYVDKILRGAKPADIPVEQPTKFELVINLTTAKALGLEMPPMLLARADEVIE